MYNKMETNRTKDHKAYICVCRRAHAMVCIAVGNLESLQSKIRDGSKAFFLSAPTKHSCLRCKWNGLPIALLFFSASICLSLPSKLNLFWPLPLSISLLTLLALFLTKLQRHQVASQLVVFVMLLVLSYCSPLYQNKLI